MRIDLGIPKPNRQSKGRNGWFTPALLQIIDVGGDINLSVYSRRSHGEAPIDLYLPMDILPELIQALAGVVDADAKQIDQGD